MRRVRSGNIYRTCRSTSGSGVRQDGGADEEVSTSTAVCPRRRGTARWSSTEDATGVSGNVVPPTVDTGTRAGTACESALCCHTS